MQKTKARSKGKCHLPEIEPGLGGGGAESEGESLVAVALETEHAGSKQKRLLWFPPNSLGGRPAGTEGAP